MKGNHASEKWLLKREKATGSDESLLNISVNKSNCELAFIKENEYWHKLFEVLLKMSKMIFIELRLRETINKTEHRIGNNFSTGNRKSVGFEFNMPLNQGPQNPVEPLLNQVLRPP